MDITQYSRKDIEYIKFPLEIKSFRRDEKYFYFEGYLSTFGNEDRGGDVVLKGAFIESLKVHIPSLLWSHKMSEVPLGVFDDLKEDDKGLYIKARMPLEDTFVKERIVPQMEIGSIKAMSIGYSVMDGGVDFVDGVRLLKQVFLWEGSLVTIPMNPEAQLKTKAASPYHEDLPIADRKRPWDKLSAIGRVRDWAGAEDGGLEDPEVQSKYKKAFLWYDEEDPDIYYSYKLPIADVINGELTVVPRAVFAAAAAMRGARGGVYMYHEDRPRVMNTIEKYYEKIGLPSPFQKSDDTIFRIDDLEMEERSFEKALTNGVTMSKTNAKTLISLIKAGKAADGRQNNQQRDADGEENYDWSDVLNSIKQINN